MTEEIDGKTGMGTVKTGNDGETGSAGPQGENNGETG
jgi:hypothetical protein